jgi:hypothetical protein
MAMKLHGIIFFFIVITGCEDVIDRSLMTSNPLIVVEGLLTNELTQHRIKIGSSYANSDGAMVPVTGAVVTITEGSNVYNLTADPLSPGEYLTPTMRALFGRVYTLHIQYAGKDYTASDSSVPVEPLTPIQYHAVTGGYVLNMNESGQNPNYIRHEITWSGSCPQQCEGLVVFYDLKTIDIQEGTKPPKEDFVFPAGSTVVRRKYSVSAAYKTFLRAMMSETEWRGGFFDVERANAPTNLTGGAIGFFAVTTVVVDSKVIN